MKKALKRSLSLLLAITIIIGSAYVGLSEVDFGGLFAVEAKAADVGSIAEFNGHYYKVFDKSLGWIEAKKFCEDIGGKLVCIETSDEQEFLFELISSGTLGHYWLGGIEKTNGIWEWLTGEVFYQNNVSISFSNWNKHDINDPNDDEPNDYEGTNECYLEISKTNGSWNDNDENNATTRGFICEWEKKNNSFVLFEFNGHYYQIYDKPSGWLEAKKYCENIGGKLACIETLDEQDFVYDYVCLGTLGQYWLGGIEEPTNIWSWITGEIFYKNGTGIGYSNWKAGEPNDFEGTKECYLEISKASGKWNDNDENNTGAHGFICEWGYTRGEIQKINSYEYDDSYFDNPATSYNHELATTSCYLALSTFQSAEQGITHIDSVSLLKECGFDSESIKLYNYYSNTNPDDIGCIIAQKKINNETLIVVAVRSGDYGNEWASNVTVGTSGDHQGFDEASDIVLSRIKGYIENQSISGKVKFWLTGYSRGAATATQTAAKLNFTSIENVEFTKNDVYAYGFATPAGAIKDSDPTNLSKYGNIFHIINFHDIVPRVAPKLWGFGRYGKTYYLPFSENSWGAAVEKEQDVIDWFEYNGLDYKVDEFIATYSDIALSPVPTSNDTLGVFCEKLVNDIAILINSRSSYVGKLQNTARAIWTKNPDISTALAVKKIIELLGSEILLKPQYVTTAISYNSMLAEAHMSYGAYYLGWMEEIPADRALDYLNNGDTRHWLFNCPVDVYVYDKSGTLVAAIENDLPVEIEDTPFSYGIDENGQKYFCLPVDSEYDIKVIAREDCETTCTVNEFSNGSFIESRIATFTEIPMEKNESISASADAYSESDIINGTETGSSVEYTVQRENEQVIESSLDIFGEEIADYTYNVDVEFDSNKGTIYGGGEFTIGQFCQVTAENKPGYKFSRWVVNGETVSTEYSYRFAVKENVTIVAEYEVCEHANFTPELVSPTCTEDGYTKHTCDVCTYSYNDTFVDATGHTYQWCEKIETTTTEAGVLEYKCIVCERVFGLEKTFVLSGFSFVATDMESYSVTSYNGIVTDIKIPVTNNNCQVTAIGNGCFMDNSNITRVVIPIGIKEIGSQAFMNCTALEVVSIPTTVTSIGVEAFYGFNGTIICQKDSYAHQYAKENGIAYSFPTLEASDSKTFIDFEHQFVFSSITKCKNIDDIVTGPSTVLTLPTASLKSNGGDFYGTGSTITMFDGNTFMGDYVLIINGDTNGDSVCDALDAAQVALVMNGHDTMGGLSKLAADSNSDDEINIEDYQAIVNKVVA